MGKSLVLDSLFYHVFNKSIGGRIFENDFLKQRFCNTLSYYNQTFIPKRFSEFLKNPTFILDPLLTYSDRRVLKILAYCIMPDHYHILVKVNALPELSRVIKNTEISFTRYYNLISRRKGPLWQSRFQHVRIQTNAQLLHVSRYIHLNPTSSSLVERPEDWVFSSYNDYIKQDSVLRESWNDITFHSPYKYKKFHDDRKDYQRKLKRIKNHLI